jgi:hypothetical protein
VRLRPRLTSRKRNGNNGARKCAPKPLEVAMRYHAPLDPECPVASQFTCDLFNDPMTSAMGAPTDDIMEGFERKHRAKCPRCQEYGMANIDVI